MDNSILNRKNFLIRKIDGGIENFDTNKKISEYFLDPNKYLMTNSHVIIGKKVIGPKYDSRKMIIPFSIIGTVQEFESQSKSSLNTSKTRLVSTLMKSIASKLKEDDSKEKKNFMIINDEEFNNVCINTQNRVNINRKSDKTLENIPIKTKEKLISQEKVLALYSDHEKEREGIKRAISNYSRKIPNDLLMSKTDFYRAHKENKEMNERNRPLDEKYGSNSWIMSLRRPRDFKGTRFVNINIGKIERPIWRVVQESVPKESLEKIRKPVNDLAYSTKDSFYSKKSMSKSNNLNQNDQICGLEEIIC